MKRTKIILLLMLLTIGISQNSRAQNYLPHAPLPVCEGGNVDTTGCLDNTIQRSIGDYWCIYRAPLQKDIGTPVQQGDILMYIKILPYTIYQAPITVLSHGRHTETIAACDSFYWSRSGDTYYSDRRSPFTAICCPDGNGCDSIFTLYLTINHPTNSSTTHNVCDSLVWHGTTYRTGGSYT